MDTRQLHIVCSIPGDNVRYRLRDVVMRINLRLKLALVLLAVGALVVAGTALFAHWSFERGYVREVQARQMEQIQASVEALEREYVAADGWARVQRERRRWLRIVFAAGRSDGRIPHWARRFETDRDQSWPPRRYSSEYDGGERRGADASAASVSADGRRRPRRAGLPMRMMLLDAQRQVLIGDAQAAGLLTLTPVVVAARTVGFVGVAPGPELDELSDIRFVDAQRRQFVWIGAAFVVLCAVLAWPLSSALTARVREIAAGARELASGHYAARVHVTSNDELGRLARDFNDLAVALERIERSRREWVADISHELRTPLATMRAEVEALQDGVRPLSLQAVDALHLDVVRLGRLIDDLYDLSRSDLGALSYHKRSLDPCAVLRADVRGVEAEFEKTDIAVQVNAAVDVQVHADADRLSQLFRNLLANSARYTDTGGRLEIEVTREGRWVVFAFNDSAPGVPGEELPHLFERFHRVERSRSRDTGGAGLGYAICRNIALAHGGRISVDHSALGGLCVQVRLPLDLSGDVSGDFSADVSGDASRELPGEGP